MVTMDQSLEDLVSRNMIDIATARLLATEPEKFGG